MRLLIAILVAAGVVAGETKTELRTASGHFMKYYVSLPEGWKAGTRWPVVMIIDAAEREFLEPAEEFRKARGGGPFVLVTPMVTTNGGPRYRQSPGYRYSDAEWQAIEKTGRCRFDEEGLAAVMVEVRQVFGGEDRYFLTGLEAAGHTIFAAVFRHPEAVRAAAPVAPNFQERCLEEGYSSHPARAGLPLRVFAGAADEAWTSKGPLYQQSQQAMEAARKHGFRQVSVQVVPGKGHERMAAEVLAYFGSLR